MTGFGLVEAQLARITICDEKVATLHVERSTIIADMLADLAWMDIPVVRLRHELSWNDDVATGGSVHVIDGECERTGRVRVIAHPAERCDGTRCETVGHTTRTRHRRGQGMTFTYRGAYTVVAIDDGGVIAADLSAATRRAAA